MLGLNPRGVSPQPARRTAAGTRGPAPRRLRSNVPVYEEELWTSRQRQASPIHEISYRACFKPQLPALLHRAPDR